ncbi:sulfatase/phosphatase domain-containing protein [Flavobacterium sp. JAS]|uniref:sulfatase/phosphatase domain-containing protein n=1 Tax=Flavobacterium sp. JAS TaxID=2897329 RepID=UPI00351D7793
MICYASDNGSEGGNEYGTFNTSYSPYAGSRYRGQTGGLSGRKRFTHEGVVRVPGVISWPEGLKRNGVKPGNVFGEPIIGSDIFPTYLELAGIDIPKKDKQHGVSIAPLIKGEPFKRSKPLQWRNQDVIRMRDGIWKMIVDPSRKSLCSL